MATDQYDPEEAVNQISIRTKDDPKELNISLDRRNKRDPKLNQPIKQMQVPGAKL
jgi:hypothetical protein